MFLPLPLGTGFSRVVDYLEWYEGMGYFYLLFAFKILCNCLAVLKPHFEAIYSIVNSGLFNIVFANSRRSLVKYSRMVIPVFSLNTRLKFLGLIATNSARSSIELSSERWSIR